MITLFGATGYTGRLIARALERRGLAFRVAGRSAERLAALSGALTSRPSWRVADVSHPASLPALFEDTRLVINCAGPFTELGEPVVTLAAARGAHYLDLTNEAAYVYRLQQYDRLARQTGAAIVPACGFEVAITDCTVACLAHEMPTPIDDVAVVYALSAAGMSRGTRVSALKIAATSWLAYRNGQLVGQAPGGAARRGAINGRGYNAIYLPSSEIITIPSHCGARNVQAWLVVAEGTAGLLCAVVPAISWLLRTPLGWVAAIVAHQIAPPSETQRVQDRFAVKVEVTSGDRNRKQVWSGRDPYGLTAEIIAYAAEEMTAASYARSGVLAPARAIAAGPFLEWLTQLPDIERNDEAA